MTAYKKSKAIGQVTAILFDGRLYEEEEIKTALKAIPKKKKGKK